MNQEYLNYMLQQKKESDIITTDLLTLYEENKENMILLMAKNMNSAYSNPHSLLKKRICERTGIFETSSEGIICKLSHRHDILSFELIFDLLDLLYEFMIQYILYYDDVFSSIKSQYTSLNPFEMDFLNRKIVSRPVRLFIHREMGKCSYFFHMEKLSGIEMNKWFWRFNDIPSIPKVVNMLKDLIFLIHSLYNKYKFVHGDLKPDNLMIMSDGSIMILDFGLSYIEYKENKIFIDFSDVELGPNLISGNGRHIIDYMKFIISPYRFESDMMYFLLIMEFYFTPDHPLMIWFNNTLFHQGTIDILEEYKKIRHEYKAFILSKEVHLWKHFCPELDMEKWMQNFTFENLLTNLEEFCVYYQSHLA
jgi:serine/threonine protein kinase